MNNSQTAKKDEGKLEISLVPTQIIKDIAEVRMYGNKKYKDPDNWKQVELKRYKDALLRHTLEFMNDDTSVDDESGIEHFKHMACNMAFICEMLKEIEIPEEENQKDYYVVTMLLKKIIPLKPGMIIEHKNPIETDVYEVILLDGRMQLKNVFYSERICDLEDIGVDEKRSTDERIILNATFLVNNSDEIDLAL